MRLRTLVCSPGYLHMYRTNCIIIVAVVSTAANTVPSIFCYEKNTIQLSLQTISLRLQLYPSNRDFVRCVNWKLTDNKDVYFVACPKTKTNCSALIVNCRCKSYGSCNFVGSWFFIDNEFGLCLKMEGNSFAAIATLPHLRQYFNLSSTRLVFKIKCAHLFSAKEQIVGLLRFHPQNIRK